MEPPTATTVTPAMVQAATLFSEVQVDYAIPEGGARGGDVGGGILYGGCCGGC